MTELSDLIDPIVMPNPVHLLELERAILILLTLLKSGVA
jgi:hypothetical protein